MKNCVSAWRLAALPVALAAAFTSLASAQSLKETVVTATRTEQNLVDLVADVSIVDRDTIEKSGAVGVADVLARLPGVEITRNGGPGNATSVFLRGAESRFTAVYIDGIRIDSQATGGAPWEQIPLSRIERIEVLRGPAAAVYGSDAIGGVIQLFTRKGEGKPAPTVGLGLGSRGTRTAEAGISGGFATSGEGSPVIDYALGISHERSDGFNARPIATANPDDDGYSRTSGNARVGLQIDARQRIEGTWLASNLNSQYDGSLTADDRNHNQLRTAGAAWLSKWTDRYATRVQLSESTTQYSTTPSVYLTETRLRNFLFQNEYRLGAHLFTAALERREDRLQNPTGTPAIDGERAQTGLALGYGYTAGPHSVQANLRRDHDSEFGGKTTGSAAYGYALTPQWRATVSAGNSFRAPTLYQRFSEYGKASLQPESGHNVEAGLRWTEGATSVGMVAYRNRVKNLIVFGGAGACASAFGCYDSVGRAEYKGVTLTANHSVAGVSLRGSIDVQDPRDLDSDHQLARRARRHAAFGADTRVAGWTVGAEVQLSARRFDNAANTAVLGGYGVANLYADTQVTRDLTLLARLNNLGDKSYQTARTYANEGRSLYVGLKWAPQ
ncbi:TonB-dependent receptor [Rhodoferax koreense]|uniref:TonB-dependent receptor n=1 Tax=Rhodoferax koreensis TaxID=1842727 RepID=A0A1P8JVD9_9BURK|nr:TonB-dependent receptor [Rhodoferax koreense]APW37698.1 TonB-dependent receptor [Rhodoferax koreense]